MEYDSIPLELKVDWVERLDGPDFNSAVDADPGLWRYLADNPDLLRRYRRNVVVTKVVELALVEAFGRLSYFNVREVAREAYDKIEAVEKDMANLIASLKEEPVEPARSEGDSDEDDNEYDDVDEEERYKDLWLGFYQQIRNALLLPTEEFRSRVDSLIGNRGGYDLMMDAIDHDLSSFLPFDVARPDIDDRGSSERLEYERKKARVNLIVLKAVLDEIF